MEGNCLFMKNNYKKSFIKKGITAVFSFCLFFALFTENNFTVYATSQDSEYYNEPIQSNEIKDWPQGPQVGASAAILVEAETGTILYAKNIHRRSYPASTTKILTTLIAAEQGNMSDMVSFSKEAVFSIEPRSSNMGMDVGQKITMEQCLYGILVYSANETSNAVAEHIGGSMPNFVDMMNKRAAELGCTESHFMNAHGLYDDNHYTTPYDYSLIAREFFKNEMLCKMSSTNYYEIEPTADQPDLIQMSSHNQLLPNRKYTYDYLVGSKTGFTVVTRQTLVSCAEKDGMKLICIVMKEESPNQFTDTIALFDYGFNNFQCVNIADNEDTYTLGESDFFNTNNAIFGSSKPIMNINQDDFIVIPKTADFKDTVSSLSYDDTDNKSVATVNYTYYDTAVGSAKIELTPDTQTTYDFDSPVAETTAASADHNGEAENIIFINILKVIGIVVLIAALFIGIMFLRSFLHNYHFSRKKRKRRTKNTLQIERRRNQIRLDKKRKSLDKSRKKRKSNYIDFK